MLRFLILALFYTYVVGTMALLGLIASAVITHH